MDPFSRFAENLPANWLSRERLPQWTDTEAVAAMFDDSELIEWAFEWWRPEVHARPTKRVRRKGVTGRPKGAREQKASRAKKWPVHRAAAMALFVKDRLREMYPEQRRGDIRDCALLAVERMWRKKVTVGQLHNYFSRPQKHRGRLI